LRNKKSVGREEEKRTGTRGRKSRGAFSWAIKTKTRGDAEIRAKHKQTRTDTGEEFLPLVLSVGDVVNATRRGEKEI